MGRNRRGNTSQSKLTTSQSTSQQHSTEMEVEEALESEENTHGNPIILEDANNVVRAIILQGTEHKFTKNDFKFIKSKKNWEVIIKEAKSILHEVYGLELMDCDDNPKTYVVRSIFQEFDIGTDEKQDSNRVFLFIILSHILMSKKKVDEVSMFSFLKQMGVDINTPHKDFGLVEDLMYKKFVQQGYLEVTTDAVSKTSTFDWGTRAHLEIPKEDVISLVHKINNGEVN